MNLLLLPKELEDLIGEFNVEHKPQMQVVMKQLLLHHKKRACIYELCANCGSYKVEKYTTYIMWRKYTFCGELCQYDGETDIRKSYRMSFALRKLNK